MSIRKQAKRLGLLGALCAIGLLSLAASSATAATGPIWQITAHHGPSNFSSPGKGQYTFYLENVGDEAASGPVTLQVDLPPGVTTRNAAATFFPRPWFTGLLYATGWDCSPAPAGASSITCAGGEDPVPARSVISDGAPIRPLGPVIVYVEVEPGTVGPLTATATVTGGGADSLTVAEAAPLGPEADAFGVEPGSFNADALDRKGNPERQAGSHPDRAFAEFDLNRRQEVVDNLFGNAPFEADVPVDFIRTATVRAPRGFVGNPNAVARCPEELLMKKRCPSASQVGSLQVAVQELAGRGTPPKIVDVPVFNLNPSRGALAAFGAEVGNREVKILASLDPSDYSVIATAPNLNTTLTVHWQRLTLWGDPSDPIHDGERWNPQAESYYGAPFDLSRRPFLSLPTECNKPDTSDLLKLTSWGDSEANAADGLKSEPAEVVGCDKLQFDPTIEVKPTTSLADAPSGLEFEMRIPQSEDVEGLATAHLRDAVVRLPEGMTVNPPSADGLGACSMAQVGIDQNGTPTSVSEPDGDVSPTPVSCPDSSKLGTLEAISPALQGPAQGTVYLAEQGANPFGSLLALYLVVEDKERGLLVKLPGRVDPDPVTGQLTATFRNNPQLPVEELRLKLFEGPRAALKTPSSCGTYEATGTLTPWSAPEAPSVGVTSSFELAQGPGGGACLPGGGSAPNAPSFSAGTMDPTAKAFSPFVMKPSRADGTQQLKAIDTTLPKGLLGKLAGTTYCADASLAAAAGKSGKAEQAQASCPASSHVGSVNVGAGAGSTPLYVQGQAYLAGPYKGAPLSLAIVTPAVAGPFDLGVVVVRTALNVDPGSAQIHAVSDTVPHILQGIPLNIRSIALKMDRPEFTLNPTSCDPMAVNGSALTLLGQSAPLSSPFQVGGCQDLGFKPKLQIRLKGGTKRGGHPALTATVKARPGDANIARTVVALPHSEFLAQGHIRTICTRVQFAADACPKGSIYGTASARTPLLDEALTGNAYLRSSSNKLPDLVIALRGKIDIDLVGRIDSVNGGIRTTFATVPDAPVSKFTLRMAGGKKSLLENSKSLCRSTNKASVQMGAQNGKSHDFQPAVKSAGCKAKQRKQQKRR